MILFWLKGYPQLAWNERGSLLGRTTKLYIGSSASVLKGHRKEDECEIPAFIYKQTNILGFVIKPLHMVRLGKQNLHIIVCSETMQLSQSDSQVFIWKLGRLMGSTDTNCFQPPRKHPRCQWHALQLWLTGCSASQTSSFTHHEAK